MFMPGDRRNTAACREARRTRPGPPAHLYKRRGPVPVRGSASLPPSARFNGANLFFFTASLLLSELAGWLFSEPILRCYRVKGYPAVAIAGRRRISPGRAVLFILATVLLCWYLFQYVPSRH